MRFHHQALQQQRKPALKRGQAAVEWALITPVIALLLAIAGDLMRMYYTSIEVNNAAKAGVQYGAQSPETAADLAGMQQAAKNDAANLSGMTATASMYCECPNSSTTFDCSTTNTCADKRVYVEVDTAATFTLSLRYPGVPSSIQLAGVAKMREE
jgi:Flp pilus assembly protein TadG